MTEWMNKRGWSSAICAVVLFFDECNYATRLELQSKFVPSTSRRLLLLPLPDVSVSVLVFVSLFPAQSSKMHLALFAGRCPEETSASVSASASRVPGLFKSNGASSQRVESSGNRLELNALQVHLPTPISACPAALPECTEKNTGTECHSYRGVSEEGHHLPISSRCWHS